ncbi:unnamed protein product [Schistosoma mattheei]|uniref:Uncharacterized protein n=2 Tax=Schistosoma TaxID=6181 RepID=A0A183JJU3_9TREM|nr:unnamed protein product [Schistosoma curassoni]VDO80634.1 unnamed protein product [Schistosoma mattheei]
MQAGPAQCAISGSTMSSSESLSTKSIGSSVLMG